MRVFLLVIGCVCAGFVAGWLARGVDLEQEVVASSVPPSEPPVADAASLEPLNPVSRAGAEPFTLAMDQVRALLAQERFSQAYDLLLDAVSLAVDASFEDEFTRVLAALVDAYTKELIALKQVQRIDAFYEQLSLDYPQYAEYQFRLGKIRVQMGNHQEALLPLAQVVNHPQFGAEARQLINQIENSATDLAFMELPLTGDAGQFIVEAEIDAGIKVKLLVDTGAAITAIDRGVLQQAGYDMNADPQYFATANGVVAAPVITLSELRLGQAGVQNLSVGALKLDMRGGVVGLLGMNFLRHYDFRIDQTRRVLILDQR